MTGDGVRGLASPHPFMGATTLACSKSGSGECGLLPGPFVEGDMECGWFLLVAGRAWCRRVLVCSSWLRHGERLAAFERRLLAVVVDVSVIMQLKFQQSFVEFYKVPQLQFIDRVVVITGTEITVQTVQTGDSTVQFFACVLTCPLCVSRQCRKPWISSGCKY